MVVDAALHWLHPLASRRTSTTSQPNPCKANDQWVHSFKNQTVHHKYQHLPPVLLHSSTIKLVARLSCSGTQHRVLCGGGRTSTLPSGTPPPTITKYWPGRQENGSSRLLQNLATFCRTMWRLFPEVEALNTHCPRNLGCQRDAFLQYPSAMPYTERWQLLTNTESWSLAS
jgi:hypothetical protein